MLPALQAEEALWWAQVLQFSRLAQDDAELTTRRALVEQWREQAGRIWQGVKRQVDEFGRQIVTTGAELKTWLAGWGVTG